MKGRYYVFPSRLGDVVAVSNESEAIVRLEFLQHCDRQSLMKRLATESYTSGSNNSLAEAERQVTGYLAGNLREFELPIDPEGSAFQQRVWSELRGIPYGYTISYGELAGRLGNPRASRAVGRANATNPICLVVPCHRVIGQNGTLTGYAGGLPIKQALLELEGVLLPSGLGPSG